MPKESYRSVLVVARADMTTVYVEGLPVVEIKPGTSGPDIKVVSAKRPDNMLLAELTLAGTALKLAALSVEPLVEQPTKPKEEHETKQ